MIRRRGFTLIELSVVIVILAMMAAIVVPRLSSVLAGARSRQYRADVKSLLGFAREDAIRSGQTRTVAYEESSFSVSANDAETTTALKSVAAVDNVSAGEFAVDGETVGDGEWTLRFYADGRADSGRFTLTEGSTATTFRIKEQSGLIEISADDSDANVSDDEEKWAAGDTISAR